MNNKWIYSAGIVLVIVLFEISYGFMTGTPHEPRYWIIFGLITLIVLVKIFRYKVPKEEL